MKCPGQDTKYWTSEAIFEVECPQCSKAVEFYKDDTTRKCTSCGHRFVNPKMDFGCAAYCQYAEQCLGTLPEEFVVGQDSLLKDKVAVAVKRMYGSDFQAIAKVLRTARYAERIGLATKVDLAATLCAAYLLGIEEASHAAGESAVTIAARILGEVQASEPMITAVTRLLTETKGELEQSTAQEVLNDARLLADWETQLKALGPPLPGADPALLQTAAGKKEAEALLSPGP